VVALQPDTVPTFDNSFSQAQCAGNSIYFFHDYSYVKLFLERLKNVKLFDVKNAARKYTGITSPMLFTVQ